MGGWRQQGDGERGQPGRSLRNRRHKTSPYRRIFQESHQTKRLFTPEIKRFLKGWLVRRRKNPYPNRTEKKELAYKTGLTYIQICNWFANWRRKLKNSSRNSEDSWGHLIKDYNNKAKGNVEQFSISSDDSIWDETAFSMDSEQNSTTIHDHQTDMDHCYYSATNNNGSESEATDFGRGVGEGSSVESEGEDQVSMVEGGLSEEVKQDPGKPVLLSKWLESAARYTAKESYVPWAAYNVTWESADKRGGGARRKKGAGKPRRRVAERHREELEAAEALTFLSVWPVENPHNAWHPITGH